MAEHISCIPWYVFIGSIVPFVPLLDRWRALRKVSTAWRHIVFQSMHLEGSFDLTWCTGDDELDSVVKALHRTSNKTESHIKEISLYGPQINYTTIEELLSAVDLDTLSAFHVESKQVLDTTVVQLSQCQNLTRLDLSCVKIHDSIIVKIARGCSKLENLDLSGCSRVSDEGVIAVAAYCDDLTSINLDMCHRITDRSVFAMASRQHQTLTAISLNRCIKVSAWPLQALLANQKNITSISFENCPKVQGIGFMSTSQATQKHSCQLSHISVSGCACIDDEGVSALLSQHRPTLMSLRIASVLSLTSKTYQEIVASCTRLKTLDLSMCKSVRDEDIGRIMTYCTDIQLLLLQGCIQLTDTALQSIASHGKAIKTLSLEFCYNITDAGISAIALQCTKLQNLNLRACNQITQTAFHAISQRSNQDNELKTLNIGGCATTRTTLQYISIVKKRYPRCRIRWT